MSGPEQEGRAPQGLEEERTSATRIKVAATKAGVAPKTMRVTSILREVGSMRRAAEVDNVLAELDRDQDGTIDVNELLNMVENVIKSRRERRYMWFAIIALFVFAVATVGTIIGLTYAIVNALKDTQVSGGVMYVKGSDVDVVRTGSAEFSVMGGVMVSRDLLNMTANTNVSADTPPPQAVLQTASFLGTPQPLSSRIDLQTLFELKFLHIKGVGAAELGVMVMGVARVPQAGSIFGSVVRMITSAGTITLDGTVLTFSSEIADIFLEAGFRVSSNRRLLLGTYDVFGFFNAIKDLSVFNLPDGQAKPQLPSKNYLLSLKIYEPCELVDVPDDRCIYFAPKAPASDGSARRRMMIAVEDGSAASELVVDRSLQGSFGEEIAGVEVVDGVRYMAHTETTVNWEGVVRNEAYFALYPGFRKVEVSSPDSDVVSVWQEEVFPEGSSNIPETTFCRGYTMPPGLRAKGSVPSDNILNFTYEGVDSIGDKFARHFRLTIKQPNLTQPMIVNYWDSVIDMSPLAFNFDHPILGHLIMDVVDFRNVTSADVATSAFVAPDKRNCPDKSLVPQLSSPFTVRTEAASPSGSDGQRRRVLELEHTGRALTESRNCEGTVLNLYNGALGPCEMDVNAIGYRWLKGKASCTGDVGIVSLSGNVDVNMCTQQASGCIDVTVNLPGNWLLDKVHLAQVLKLKACAVYDPDAAAVTVRGMLTIPLAIFKVDVAFNLRFSACCIWVEEVKLEGFVYVVFFTSIGWQSLGTYTAMQQKYIKGGPAALTEESNPSLSNVVTWLTVAEGFVGDWKNPLYCSENFYSAQSGSGTRTLVGRPINSYQLRMDDAGSSDKTALNGVRLTCENGNVIEETGLFGTWVYTMESCDGVFQSARMRVEAQKSGDNTAANSIQFKCDSVIASAHLGYWGEWTDWAACPSGTYVCGIQIRTQKSQGNKDDTAVNGAKIACCSYVDN